MGLSLQARVENEVTDAFARAKADLEILMLTPPATSREIVAYAALLLEHMERVRSRGFIRVNWRKRG